jgi:DNA modification methylase
VATFRIIEGEAVETMRCMADSSVDAVVTDSPYELAFMGKSWDSSGVTFRPETWAEVFRVLKDGGRLLAFGGTRTYHRMTCAIEDGGFLIEDCIMWVYGSGFPKHKSKLKPAYEPIVVARKGRASHLNIDECRIAVDPEADAAQLRTMNRSRREDSARGQTWGLSKSDGDTPQVVRPEGRWPANVILDEEAGAALDEQSGTLKSGVLSAHHKCAEWGYSGGERKQPTLQDTYGDSGGASRFYYCAKADTSERNAGLEGMPLRPKNNVLGDGLNSASKVRTAEQAENGVNRAHAANHHPTVKPVALMQWLCRLVTPEGGIVLDPFCGSGSTGIAAMREGFNFIGIEREVEYVEIARRRIVGDAPMFNREDAA